MVEPHQVKNRRMKIMHVHTLFDRGETEFIGRSVAQSRLDASTCHPNSKAIMIVVASLLTFRRWCSSEFATPNH